jgi:hypothetical protein
MQILSFMDANLQVTKVYSEIRDAVPEHGAKIDEIVSLISPAEKASRFFEFVYANGENLSETVRATAADVGDFALLNGFFDLAQDGRGNKMSIALRREVFIYEEGDPEPKTEYSVIPAMGV